MTEPALNLIWIDLEMTGLDPENDRIIEVATLVTDPNLNLIAEGPIIAVHQSESIMNSMDDWNQRHHGRSGLIERVKNSKVTESVAEEQTIEFLQKHIDANTSPMCGNSICQDRRFLAKYMPTLERFFHYRNLDVSTIKELAVRWKPEITKTFTKESSHRAMDDIQESVEELKHYRENFFKP